MASVDPKVAAVNEEPEWMQVLSSSWMLPVILALSFAAYASTFDDWFKGDDFWFLRASQQSTWGDYITRVLDPRKVTPDYELNRYRPLYPLAWKLQFALFGLTAWPYHLVLVSLHLLCVTLAWFIFRRLFKRMWHANVATMICALHPAYAGAGGAVAWLSGGNRVFAAVLYLAALLLFMKYLDPLTRRRSACFVFALLFYMAAMLTHSSTVTLAAVLALYMFLIAGESRDPGQPRNWLPLLPFGLVAAAEMAVQVYVRHHTGVVAFEFGWHMWSVMGQYLGMTLVPIEPLRAADISAIVEQSQLLASIGVLCLLFATIYRRPTRSLGIFAAAWLLLAFLPDSTFIGGAVGRAMYGGSFALAVVAVTSALWIGENMALRSSKRVQIVASCGLALLVAALVLASAVRAANSGKQGSEYQGFFEALRSEGPSLPANGTLYIQGAPNFGPFNPPSLVISLAQLEYGTVPIVLLGPGESAQQIRPQDRVFEYQD